MRGGAQWESLSKGLWLLSIALSQCETIKSAASLHFRNLTLRFYLSFFSQAHLYSSIEQSPDQKLPFVKGTYPAIKTLWLTAELMVSCLCPVLMVPLSVLCI